MFAAIRSSKIARSSRDRCEFAWKARHALWAACSVSAPDAAWKPRPIGAPEGEAIAWNGIGSSPLEETWPLISDRPVTICNC